MEGEGEGGRNDLQNLLRAIKASEVRESRIQLINQLADAGISEKSDLASLAEFLPTFWEDSTCSDISQCMLNKTILHVAAKYVELDMPNCLGQFIVLGTKASIWCGKHLQITITSIEEFQEEKHSSLFFQLVLDLLSFSSASFSALARSPIFGEQVLMPLVEEFISEQLKLTKASISEIKRIHSVASEVLKVAPVVLDAAIRLCRAYSDALKWVTNDSTADGDEASMDGQRVENMTHVIKIATCTIENLYELGILAATGGGSLVTILNISWKGVVMLLQCCKELLADKINVGDIILTLISLATESLRCAAEAWSSTFKDTLAVTEAKRTFLPIKFYLINAVRISSQYPCQAVRVYKEITLCVLVISAFGVSLSKDTHLKAASEALAEFLEPTSFLLLHTLLNSAEVESESQFQILDWLFAVNSYSNSFDSEEIVSNVSTNPTTSMDEIFIVNCETMPRTRVLILGRVVLFLNLLKNSPDLREEVVIGISRRLGCLMDFLINEDIYSSVLALHIPVLYGSGPTSGLAWQPIFSSVLHALKTLMIVATSSPAWDEVESFLFGNLLHPHFLCWEIIMELWCFLVRHAETEMVNDIFDRLCSLFKIMALSETIRMTCSPLRKMARSICMLLTYAPQSTGDRVYSAFDNQSPMISITYIALLIEGFPLDSLSDNLKKLATQKILTGFHGFMENNDRKIGVDSSLRSGNSNLLGLPVYALSSMLRSLQINSSDIDERSISRVLKFTVAVIDGYKSAKDSSKVHYGNLLNQMLEIISHMKNLYLFDEMEEVILELQTLFVVSPEASDSRLDQCKPYLASFVAGVSHMELSEGKGSKIISAVWDLYHILLRERQWAFVHLAITAFGYFAARTSCNQLWRFVPHDAALSFDVDTGKETNEERFMSELKVFLEKEAALVAAGPCIEQLDLLAKEGLILKERAGRVLNIDTEVSRCEIVEIDDGDQVKKKRKLPDGIGEGMALLQRGLKVVGDGLAIWRQEPNEFTELHDKFSAHISCLEDVISQLVRLADS